MARQLLFDLPFDGTPDDFIVAEPNRIAFEKLQHFAEWAEPGIVICGPQGCGKTALAHLWGKRTAAVEITDVSGVNDYLGADCLQPAIIDNAEMFAIKHPEALFHLYQRLVANGAKMVLLASKPAQQWEIALADIASRIRALPQIEITPPDDGLTEMLLLKYFTERGIAADPEIIEYLLTRVPRDAATLQALVIDLDKDALETRKRLNLSSVKQWAKEKGL